ncbi:MAG: monofunctional biosynthetic peptidoglycan transglycosylase [Coprobacter sp.]|nr:monofunctional biosynthetic peptidoglycan transglycosylase [Barnesiella sp. GGCC_0306]MBS7040579.1 monofunctional biosynthetic peptidoglycan transglycosylase [Bacteroidales bacterium]PWM93477.1 MAG: monofunctional biosynthetic peptidoglycan transglycosylase [Coprobacter sp.]
MQNNSKNKWAKKAVRWMRNLFLFFLLSSVGAVIILKYMPVYITPLMLIRSVQNVVKGDSPRFYHEWVPLNDISRWLPLAVVASEDNLFMTHHGFDFNQIQKAIEENKTRKRARGASTISQQTAKNVFLWPGHSVIRKGLEIYFTFLIEVFWGKERIMEVYLNSIEMGKNIYGAQAVANKHFGRDAARLTKSQCALIAATLPNPRKFNSAAPSPYMLKRQRQIMSLMGKIAPVNFE